LNVKIYYRDLSTGSVMERNFEPTPCVEGSSAWDICFFCSPYIIETNVFLSDSPKGLENFDCYKKLKIFFQNRKHEKFNTLLGFDS
jgi:hypothetical protein